MTIDATLPQTRRALLAGAIGGLAALTAQLLGRPLPAQGANLDHVRMGTNNTETARTLIRNTNSGKTVLWADATGGGTGVYASTDSGIGVSGYSTDGSGVQGHARSRTGVYGFTGTGAAPSGPSRTGVYGRCDTANGIGAYGRAADGVGVLGVLGPAPSGAWLSRTAAGVHGYSGEGIGVYGYSDSFRAVNAWCPDGIAVEATSQRGTALVVEGRVTFTTAGLATLQAGTDHVRVTPGVGIESTSKILCTLHGDPGGSTTIQRVTRDAAENAFTIHATADVTDDCPVSWFVIS